ncbi:uncharacterized protein P884DRAFT_270832 [Thermothelomyces heterothallicus CBS 202.75]|uniref:uncharacterized protein n=1 Tax=Thermothelomyces heterothallicus CBS 202.75 TaxID=1149848 RepID=UPI003743FF4E
MQAVPSLAGTGTATAAAAVGLVFGQPPEPEVPWSSPVQHRFPADYDGFRAQAVPPRPSTSAVPNYHPCSSPTEEFPYSSFHQLADEHPSPLASNPTSPLSPLSPLSPTSAPRPMTGNSAMLPRSSSRRHSFIRPGDLASQPISENKRDSVSSRDSWIRRLSLRPLSQHGSRRSSVGPDSSSMAFSHGSSVPILGQPPTSRASPNKLVKRTTTSGQNGAGGDARRRGSISQVLTLRRPATSHQRSATMQEFQHQLALAEPLSRGMKVPLDGYNPSPTSMTFAPTRDNAGQSGRWTSFFHARRSSVSGGDISGLPPGSSPLHNLFPRRRLSLARSHDFRAYLTKPSHLAEVSVSADEAEVPPDQLTSGNKQDNKQDTSLPAADLATAADSMADRPPRRSFSMHFSSASNWIARTGNSRRPRRSTIDAKSGAGSDVPDPGAVPHDQAQTPVQLRLGGSHAPPKTEENPHYKPEPELGSSHLVRTRKRNSSSPLPPLNHLPNLSTDVTRGPTKALQSPINYSHTPSVTTHSRGPSGERSVTLAGSDVSARDGTFRDDEDTDFKSDDMYDSFRTGASSNRMRSVETPAESVLDESPLSTANNGRTKRLSIQEMLGRSWDGETKITEEDEGIDVPTRPGHQAGSSEFDSQGTKNGFGFEFSGLHGSSLADPSLERLSFDDDDDDDWPRDDENTLSNHLSPPSSTNSRRVSPTMREALRNISGNGSLDCQRESMSDRPRSNIFDWSEPSVHDKLDSGMPRPKTAHGKQEPDLRGGRTISRKLPGAAHIRSQSVPVVVPDFSDGSKQLPKFGTWGLGTKTASEDWDDDFEFDGEESAICSPGGKDSATSFSVVVPASIQATQPSVRAHSGQIRELSLLVNDLKRLCRHGKDLDILRGPLASKWADAESIIALASPDEEDEDLGSTKPSMDFDRSKIDEQFLEDGFDGSFLDHIDESFGFSESEMSKTAVIRERHSPKRRSVFSPEDDIFGNWPLNQGSATPSRCSSPSRNSAVVSTVIEAIKKQQQKNDRAKGPGHKTPDTKLFFDTNSLQELVKRAGQLRDALSDAVRKAELLTQSPAGTPRRERHSGHQNLDGSPAFTRVFVDPGSSPPRRLPNSRSNPSILSRASIDSPRMQMMTVS